jgi:hypothetical protein
VAKTEDEYWNIHDFCHTFVRSRLAAEKKIPAVRHKQTREGEHRSYLKIFSPMAFLCALK